MSELRPMSEAPTTGYPVQEIAIAIRDQHGNKKWITAHWAYGGGDDQPPFGPAWFQWCRSGYVQLDAREFLGWIPLPTID